MTILLRCPSCQQPLKVKEELAGKKVKCPGCGVPVPVPLPKADSEPEVEMMVAEDADPAEVARYATRPRVAPKATDEAIQIEEGEPQVSAPRARARGKSDTESPQWVPCPKCGATNAKRVKSTFWGASIGPKLFNHVRCQECRATYNGKTGGSNILPALGCLALFFVALFLIVAVRGIIVYIKRFYQPEVKEPSAQAAAIVCPYVPLSRRPVSNPAS